MKYNMYWFDDSQNVLILQFQDDITWDDFHVIIDEAHTTIKAQEHPVHLVLWYKTGRLPRGNPVVQFQSVVKRQPKNTGRIVIINPELNTGIGKYVTAIAGMMQRLKPNVQGVQLVSSYEEACAKLDLLLRKTSDK